MSQTHPIRLAIVEDDAILREELAIFLSLQGHEVLTANSGRGLDDLLLGATVDVVVLDLNLPGESGFEIAERLRRHAQRIGIVMMTARLALPDRVKGYESGADIYLTKPVQEDELRAAIVSLHRRLHAEPTRQWVLDSERGLLRAPGQTEDIRLTGNELSFLLLFARSAQGSLDSATVCDLMEHPDSEQALSKRALENIVSRLRKKLQPFAPPGQTLIQSVWGTGYRLCLSLKLGRLD